MPSPDRSVLDASGHFIGNMTTRKYVGMTKCSNVTASRDLADLVTKGVLLKTADGGRSTSYTLCMTDSPTTATE